MKGAGKRGARSAERGAKRPLSALRAPRSALLLACLLSPVSCLAQAPDVRARLDFALTLDYRNDDSQTSRLYSPLGRPSTVALSLVLETGYNVVVSERLQRLPHDADGDIFDEAYIEDPGIFRVGKQYLPFGAGRLLRESAAAARIDSNLIAEGVPVALAYCDAGPGRQSGLVLHAGRALGASLAVGDHFGISGTSLGVVRHPEDAAGRGGGWKQAFGFDASRRLGKLALSAEFGAFNGGPQRSLSVLDLETTYYSDGYRTIGLGYTHSDGERGADLLRLFGRIHAARNLDLEPFLRLRNGDLYDLALTLRLRL